MITQNIYQAKAKLSSMVNSALEGEDVFISKAGVPVAKIVSIKIASQKRVPGTLKGKIKIKGNFFDSDKEIEEMFYTENV